jgi:hypothetical protein
VELAVGAPFQAFAQRFVAAASADLCQEGGVLYEQWEQAQDFDSHTLVERLLPILTGLDLTDDGLGKVLVPLAAILIHQGGESFCMQGVRP